MRKWLSGLHLIILLAPAISLILVITIIATAVAETEQQIAALFSMQDRLTVLMCDGTYDDKNINLHIWSGESNLTGSESLHSSSSEDAGNKQAIQGAIDWAKKNSCRQQLHLWARLISMLHL